MLMVILLCFSLKVADVSLSESGHLVPWWLTSHIKSPISQLDIGVWIANAIQVKWPCEVPLTQGVVTDPDLIKKLDALRENKK
jgi:hypothetical protein